MRRTAWATTRKARSAPSRSIGRTGTLKPLNTVRSGGAGPTYVSIHPSGRFVLVANYFGGSVAVLPILPDGRLGDATDVKRDAGRSGPRRRQTRRRQLRRQRPRPNARPHDPGRPVRTLRAARGPRASTRIFVVAVRRGARHADRERPARRVAAGRRRPAPRPLPPERPWLYSIQEEGSTIVLFDYDAATDGSRAADDLDAAAGVRRQQLLLGDPGVGRRQVRVRRQPPARQHRHLRGRARTAS